MHEECKEFERFWGPVSSDAPTTRAVLFKARLPSLQWESDVAPAIGEVPPAQAATSVNFVWARLAGRCGSWSTSLVSGALPRWGRGRVPYRPRETLFGPSVCQRSGP